MPPKQYPTGTLTFEHTFTQNGKFIGIVTVKNEHGQTYVSQFPFAVGQPFAKSVVLYVVLVGLLGVGFTVFGDTAARRSRRPRLSQILGRAED